MSAVAYRNSELYRYGANYQFGVFPLGYRNSYDYRSAIQYRSGVDDPIFDSFTVNVTETLTVSVTPTDTGAANDEALPGIHVQSLAAQGTTESQQFLELSVGTVGLNLTEVGAGVESLEVQGTSLNSVDSSAGTEGTAGLYFTLEEDSGSGTDSWVSTSVTMTLPEAMSALESLPEIALSNTDVGTHAYGSSMAYRSSFEYQNSRDYRYRFGLMGIRYQNDYPYRMEGMYAEGLMSGTMVDVVPVDAETLLSTEFLDYSGGGNDRTTTQSEEILVTFNLQGPFGEVAQHLSHIAVNRYRPTPSAVRRR